MLRITSIDIITGDLVFQTIHENDYIQKYHMDLKTCVDLETIERKYKLDMIKSSTFSCSDMAKIQKLKTFKKGFKMD